MTKRTIPVDIPEDLYLDCLVAVRIESSEEHPVIAVLRRALRGGGMLGQADYAFGLAVREREDWQLIAEGHAQADADVEASIRQLDIERRASVADNERRFGSRSGGINWGPLFLPNTTRVRMHYKGDPYEALVAHDTLRWRDQPMSPSEFVAAVAGGTVRNPWRDLEIWCHPDNAWVRADALRKDKQASQRLVHELTWKAEQERTRALARAEHWLSGRPSSTEEAPSSD